MNKSVLYIGPLNKNGTCYQRLLSFERIFYTVVRIDTYVYKNNSFIYLFNALLNKFNIWLDFVNANKLIKSQNFNYDIVWIDKGLTIKKSTLLKIKTVNKKIIHYSPDDMLNPRNQSKRYLNCISIYDLHVTTKSYNVSELLANGALKSYFINNCYDDLHHVKLNKLNQNFDVGFIGSFEIERANVLYFLAKSGYKIAIRGNWPIEWLKKFSKYNVNIKSIELTFPEYNLFIADCKINLCFLRKVNRDLQTTRTMEIPAMGGFMIAEDTLEHRLLFDNNNEVVLFKDQYDLQFKIDFYLNNDISRKQIAENGYKRSITSGYSNYNTFNNLFKELF